MKISRLTILAAVLAGCVAPPKSIDPDIDGEFAKGAERKKPVAPQLEQALIPPLRMEMPLAGGAAIDSRFDLAVSAAPAAQVFSSLVSGTRYSMLVHPSVEGTMTVNLKDVTMREALESIRDLYGYEYKIDGTRVFIQPAGVQTRVFQVNYLSGQRRGMSQVRVNSNSLTDSNNSSNGTSTGGNTGINVIGNSGTSGMGNNSGTGQQGGSNNTNRESTRITTSQEATFWSDLCEALVALTFPDSAGAPTGGSNSSQQQPEDRQRALCNRRHAQSGRSIVVSPHSGVIVVRATPAELRAVDNYLRASRLAVERQVMLEAKIIEIALSDGFQSGVNWTAFNSRGAVGQVTRTPETGLGNPPVGSPAFPAGIVGPAVSNLLGTTVPAGAAVSGLALSTNNFAALLTFLETQGNVQVLSSPRIATVNNQKAVLKVGDEQLFVSNVSVTPPTIGTVNTPVTIAPVFSPYFSGIVLDVTPQIDEGGMVTLHVHPSINSITQADLKVPLGSSERVSIPTALSTVRETDTIVRVSDGNIVAIGGLMRTETNDQRSGVPGVSDGGFFGFLFRNTNRVVRKIELVILLKPTIIDSDQAWAADLRETRGRLDALGREMNRGKSQK